MVKVSSYSKKLQLHLLYDILVYYYLNVCDDLQRGTGYYYYYSITSVCTVVVVAMTRSVVRLGRRRFLRVVRMLFVRVCFFGLVFGSWLYDTLMIVLLFSLFTKYYSYYLPTGDKQRPFYSFVLLPIPVGREFFIVLIINLNTTFVPVCLW